jgi:phosphoglycolate phosphatase
MNAVIFDLDGTLINSIPDISRCMNNALRKNGLPVNDEWEYRHMTGNGAEMLTRRAVKDRLDVLDSVYADYLADYSVHCFVESGIYTGIPGLLAALKTRNLRLTVLSNKGNADVQSVLRHYFPEMPFEIMRGQITGVPLKPDPSSALSIAHDLCLSPKDIWYIGDTPTDIRCAGNAGMPCIATAWGFCTRAELVSAGAVRIADSPMDVPGLMDAE